MISRLNRLECKPLSLHIKIKFIKKFKYNQKNIKLLHYEQENKPSHLYCKEISEQRRNSQYKLTKRERESPSSKVQIQK